MKNILALYILITLNFPYSFVHTGRTRDEVIKIVDIENQAKPSVVIAPVQKGYHIENVAVIVQPGSTNGQGYDRVVVLFQSLPPKIPGQDDDQLGDTYFLAMRPCKSPKQKFTTIFETPVSNFKPGHKSVTYKQLPSNLTDLALEFRFGHKNASHNIGFEDIRSLHCDTQIRTGIVH